MNVNKLVLWLLQKESVDLALNLLDGYDLRGHRMSVEKAKFTMKGAAYDPSLKPKKRRKKDIEKLKKMQEKWVQFDLHKNYAHLFCIV